MNVLGNLLLGDCFKQNVIGPRGDAFHRMVNVKVLFGNDEHTTTKIIDIGEKMTQTAETEIEVPNRIRDLGGILITFDSEEAYTWTRRMLFHKGQVYTTDVITGEPHEY